MSKAMTNISEENLNSVRQEVILHIHETFYMLSASLELRNVAIQNKKRAEQHLKLANDRKAVGAVPESDVLRAKVSASEAKLELVRSENLVRINMGALSTVMGLPVETDIQPNADINELNLPAEISASSLLTQALMCRPEVKAVQKRIEAVRSSVTMAKSEYGPKLRAEGSYGYRDDSASLEEKEYAAGVSLELPIFSGFSTKHKVAEKKAELAKAEAEAEALIQDIQQEVWVAKSRLKEADEMAQTADLRVKDARESERMAEERYKVGNYTITDLLDVQTALAKAEAELVQAKWNLRIAKASLSHSIGNLSQTAAK